MRLRILIGAFSFLSFWYAISLTRSTRPELHDQARADDRPSGANRLVDDNPVVPGESVPDNNPPDSPEKPRLQPETKSTQQNVYRLQAYLLLIEPDWSTSPTAAEVATDLERTLAGLSLPEIANGDQLKAAPQILFSEQNVGVYYPQSCSEFMAWLEKHKLIRKKISFPGGEYKWPQPVGAVPPGFEADLVESGEFLPVPKLEITSPRPFVKSGQRWKWQVFSKPERVEVTSGLERFPIELGKEIVDSSETFRQIITRSAGHGIGESMFVSGSLSTTMGGYPGGRMKPDDKSPWPVIWFQDPEMLVPRDVEPTLRLPDRLETPKVTYGNEFPFRVANPDYVVPKGASTSESTVSATGTAPQNIRRGEKVVSSSQQSVPSAAPINTDQGITGNVPPPQRKDSAALGALRDKFNQLDARASGLAEEIASQAEPVTESDRALHRESVRAAVKEAFLAGQKLHETELAEFRDRMQRLQELIAERARNSDRIIDRRVADLLDPLDPSLKWAPPETSADQDTAPKNTDSSVTPPPNDLEGVWRIGDGKLLPGMSTTRVVFWKDRSAVFAGKQRIRFHHLKLGLDQSPFTIDLDAIEGGESSHGVYEIVGNRMRMNIIRKPEPRPESFANELFEFERVSRDVPREFQVAMSSSNAPTEVSKPEPVPPDVPGRRSDSRRPAPLSTTIGLVSDILEDLTVVVSSKERGEFQVGEELILSYVSKEGGGTYKPAGRIRIANLEDDGTALGRAFDLPREQVGNRFVERHPKEGDFVERPIDEKVAAASDRPAPAKGFEERRPVEPTDTPLRGRDRPASSPKKVERRPYNSTITVGVISEVRQDGTVVVSCKEPDDLTEGEELVFYAREMAVRNQSTRAGWIVIKEVQNAVTAIGRPSEVVREIQENRFVDRQPKPGDIVGRPVYQEDPGKGAF